MAASDAGPAARASLLAWSLRVSALVGLVAVAGATQLARWNVTGNPSAPEPIRMVARMSPALADPETTGTVTPGGPAQAARGTHLDPCRAPAVDQLRP